MKLKSSYFHLVVFLLCFIIIVSRRTDAILNPQFWAEDGTVFYADAYNRGIFGSFFLPYAGYLHFFPRLTAALSVAFPLKAAPFIFNLISITIKILPVNFLVSSRFSKLIPNITHRFFISFIYLALPGCSEINANLTNSQWHLALVLFMIFVTQSPKHFRSLIDYIFILLCGLTGPFSIIIMPIVLFLVISKRYQNTFGLNKHILRLKFLLLSVTAIIQIVTIFFIDNGRRTSLKTDLSLLDIDVIGTMSQILVNQLFLISTVGTKITATIIQNSDNYNILRSLIITLGVALLIYLLIKSPPFFRLLIVYSSLIPIIAIFLKFPNINEFTLVGASGRYWFSLILCVSLGILWFSYKMYDKSILQKILSTSLLLLMSVGIVSDWLHPPYNDFQFAKYANEFAEMSPGREIKIPINPSPWTMDLIKK